MTTPHTHGGTDAPECTTCQGRTLHDRIRAEVQTARIRTELLVEDKAMRQRFWNLCDHADRILDRHFEYQGECDWCYATGDWPCPDVRDLAEAWGVEP